MTQRRRLDHHLAEQAAAAGADFRDGVNTVTIGSTGRAAIDTLLLFASPGTGPFIRGDCNGDGQVTGQVGDAIFILNYNFLGGPKPPCFAACDMNGDGKFVGQVGDAVYVLNFNFLGGPPPPGPFPSAAFSQKDSDKLLGCEKPTG